MTKKFNHGDLVRYKYNPDKSQVGVVWSWVAANKIRIQRDKSVIRRDYKRSKRANYWHDMWTAHWDSSFRTARKMDRDSFIYAVHWYGGPFKHLYVSYLETDLILVEKEESDEVLD